MSTKKKQRPSRGQSLIAFIDLLGTSYYARTDPNVYHEHLSKFEYALEEFVPLLEGKGDIFFFSDCAYISSVEGPELIEYLTEIRAYLLPFHIYLQGAIQPGKLEPKSIANDIVKGTIFGPDVAEVYALQDALKGAAIRVKTSDLNGTSRISNSCVISCHLPSQSNAPECFWDIKYDENEIDRLTVENILVDCMRAKAVGRSGGAYYIAPLITMINSVNWSIDVGADTKENERGAKILFDAVIKDDFVKHLGDLRGAHLVLYAMLNQAYRDSEGMSVCKEIQRYIASKPSILDRIDTVPSALLSFEHRRRFLENAVVWSRVAKKKAREVKTEKRDPRPGKLQSRE